MSHTRNRSARIALVGDYDASVTAHQAIPLALSMAAQAEGLSISFDWLPTPQAGDLQTLAGFDGIWCVPASPYLDVDGALTAIRYARENAVPFLGTCGGFQHALIEYARNHLGWLDAEHAETSPDAERAVITALSCSLVEAVGPISFVTGSAIAEAYGRLDTREGYRCRYGVNKALEDRLLSGLLSASGYDEAGDIRAVELSGHPFFIATLFQPERAALSGSVPPLVSSFIRAAVLYAFRKVADHKN